MARTEYLVCRTLDPHSDCKVFHDLSEARAMAAQVGHFCVYEYEITPGIPGVSPDDATLAANHYMAGDWLRDAAPRDRDE